MTKNDEPNCFCCPEPVKLGIKDRMIIRADDHGSEDLCIVLFHRLSFSFSLTGIYPTAYFIFNEQYTLLKS